MGVGVAYALYFFGGTTGAHHLYLNRSIQAFIWATTFGGFGFAALVDLFRISEYCEEASDTDASKELRKALEKRYPKPRWTFMWVIGAWVAALYYGFVASCLVPADVPPFTYKLVEVVGAAIGVVMVSNIGHCTCDARKVFLVMVVGTVISEMLWTSDRITNLTLIAGVFAAIYTRKYPAPKPRKSWARRTGRHFALVTIFWCVVAVGMYNHGQVCDPQAGQCRPISEVVNNVIASDVWSNFWTQVRSNLQRMSEDPENSWSIWADSLDLLGTRRALRTLELEPSGTHTPGEIHAAYRRLAKIWHPDKNANKPAEASQRMAEINQAYDLLRTRN
eukprot:c46594_g1_i1.p1 GENE.c46594_g1_i1~~c46594_g1_i1.p1  ORF type:complete len:334 (-),score=40.16 c46594_g1_i1:30-1031(-)